MIEWPKMTLALTLQGQRYVFPNGSLRPTAFALLVILREVRRILILKHDMILNTTRSKTSQSMSLPVPPSRQTSFSPFRSIKIHDFLSYEQFRKGLTG